MAGQSVLTQICASSVVNIQQIQSLFHADTVACATRVPVGCWAWTGDARCAGCLCKE